MKNEYQIIGGGHHSDKRGTIFYFNDFDMTQVKRFYRVLHHDSSITRGWRGHRIEQRWFHVCKGAFEINLIEIDNWEAPDALLKPTKIIMNAEEDSILHVPAGFATSLRAISANSELVVFGDYPIEHAKNDDYLFPVDYFIA